MAIGEVGLGGAVYHSGMGDFEIVDADRVAAQMRAEEVNKSGVVSALTAFLSNDRVELERAEAGDARHGKALGEVLSAVRTYLAEAPADGEWCFTVPLEDDKILQMRQNVNGMLEAAVSHLEDAETATYFQVPLSASRLSSAIVLDMLDNPDAYPADALLDSLADSGSAAVTNPIRREVYETIVEKKCGIAPGALGILNCAAMRSLALTALSCENPGMVADLADVLLQDAQYVQDVLKIDDEQALEIMANYERKVGGDPSIGDRIDVSALKRVRTKEEVTPEQRMAMEKDAKVHAFVADLIMNDNGYEFDTSKNGGDRVYGVLLKHIDVLGDILKDGDNELLATFPEEIRAPLGEALSEIRKMANAAILLAKGIDSVFGGSNTDEAYLRKILELGKPAFDGIDEQIDEVCNGLCARVGDLVKTSVQNLRDSIGASSVKPTFDDVVAAEKPADKLKALFQVYGKVLHRVATDKDLREAVRNGSYRPQDSLRSTSQLPMDNLIDSLIRSLAKLEVDDRGQLSVYEGERDAKANKIFEASEEDVIRYCMRLVNASGDEPEVEKNLHEVLMRGENGEMVFRKEGMSDRFNSYVEVVKADYQTRFERIISIDPRKFQPTLQEMKNEAADPTRGYPQLVLDVMSRYFDVPEGLSDGDVDIRRIDRRAMVASLVRNVKCANGVAPTHGQLLGGLFKGAGPIMQKALQGLPVPETEAEMYEAIQDMKSNLAPIPSEYVEAQLGDIIERSRGEIEGIVVDRSLGAASVGQAFLCTVTMRGGEQKSCVLKLLRPDARTRALRERTLFEQVANEIGGGMPMTFKGKLDVILKEFDFTIEANNVGSGRVYDQNLAKGFAGSGVESMKLFSGVAPTAGTMLLELAPGDNVGNFCDEMRVKVGTTAAAMQTTIDDGGELKMDDIMAQGRNLAVMKACSTRLMSLTKQWTREGIFRSGFYHGDLHAGNIMFDAELRNAAEQAALKDVSRLVGDMTVIDFGNAVQLSPAQQANVTKMMMGCLVGDAKWFLPAYKDLLSEEGRQHYEELDVVRTDDNGYVVDADGEFIFDENGKRMRYAGLGETENEMMIVNDDGETLRSVPRRTCLTSMVERILSTGDSDAVAVRILVSLTHLQNQTIECPPEIFNFANGYMLLQNTSDRLATEIDSARDSLLKSITYKTEQLIDAYFDPLINQTERVEAEREAVRISRKLSVAKRTLIENRAENARQEMVADAKKVEISKQFAERYIDDIGETILRKDGAALNETLSDEDWTEMARLFGYMKEWIRGPQATSNNILNTWSNLFTASMFVNEKDPVSSRKPADAPDIPDHIITLFQKLIEGLKGPMNAACDAELAKHGSEYQLEVNKWQAQLNAVTRRIDAMPPDPKDPAKEQRDKIRSLPSLEEKLKALQKLGVEGAAELRELNTFRFKNTSDSAMNAVGEALTSSVIPFVKHVGGLCNLVRLVRAMP